MNPLETDSTAALGRLLARLKDGDAEALTPFYERFVDGLYAFVFYRVGKNPTLAEDVVQETFLYALDHLELYDPNKGSPATWLSLSSKNFIRKHLKLQQRSEQLMELWERIDERLVEALAAVDSAPLSDELIERTETRELVNMTIAHLPESYRRALNGKYVEGESLAELAEQLELSESATKSLLARARDAFRATFQTLSQALFGPQLGRSGAEESSR